MRTRILAIGLVFTFIFSSFSLVMANYFTDLKDHENEEAIYNLEKYNVLSGYPDGTYQPDKEITRAETAVIMTRINGLDKIAKLEQGRSTGFTDVPRSSPYSGYVRVATIMEIATGKDREVFDLEKEVLLEEIVAMVIRTLGYDNEGKRFGSYPVGEKIMAHKYNLLDGLSKVDYNKPATRGQVAQIVSNALEIPLMVMNSEGQWVSSDSEDFNGPAIYLTDEMALDEIDLVKIDLIVNTMIY